MDAVSRILRCRLMEKMAGRPEYSKKLGLHGENVRSGNGAEEKEENRPVTEERTPEPAGEQMPAATQRDRNGR